MAEMEMKDGKVAVGWYCDPVIGWVEGPIPKGAQTQPTKLAQAGQGMARPDEVARQALAVAQANEARLGNLEKVLLDFIKNFEESKVVSVEVGDADMTLKGRR